MRRNRMAPAVLVLLLLTACGPAGEAAPSPSPTPTATAAPAYRAEFALPVTGESLHPILGRDRVNATLTGLLWEGLFALDQSFLPQKVLCADQSVSEDGLTWTFTLRPGVTFSDGSALTAEDVTTSLTLAKTTGSRFAARLSGVRTVRAEEGAVVVTLSAPNGNLPALLDVPVVRGESEQPLGTGPYVLEGSGEDSALVARSGWWQGRELPTQRIPLRLLPEAENLISAFDAGDVSLVTADLTGTNAVGYGGSYETWDYPTTGMLYLGYNCAAKRPCADAALRAALSHGLDRNTVAGALYANHALPAALPVSPRSPLYDAGAASALSYSPQVLASSLAEAGYSKNADGLLSKGRTVLALDFVVNTDNSFRLSAAEYIADELRRAGVTVNLRPLPWSDYQAALAAGDFDLYLAETVLTADFDLSPLLLPGGALNFGKYADAETTALLNAFRGAGDGGRRNAAALLYTRLAREAPFAVIAFKHQSVLTRWGIVSGLTPTQQDPFNQIEQWKLNDQGEMGE